MSRIRDPRSFLSVLETRRWAVENSLLKRVGRPEDVAKTIVFLAEMDFVTGAVYFVDGGRALV